MQAAHDFHAECDSLAAILDTATEDDFSTVTLFNNWTISDVIGHLHVWNQAAMITMQSRQEFHKFLSFIMTHYGNGGTSLQAQYKWLDEFAGGVTGKALYQAWREFYPQLAQAYTNADPQDRVAWAGPDMSKESKMIARQMESWAHGQEVFDILGLEREDKDRIRNIAHLGVTTYSWAFRNRGEDPPAPKPHIMLTAPSGKTWQWNDQQQDNFISGTATHFCQVVTQTRNVADTNLKTEGDIAKRWMSIAQCFAGTPKEPPAPGERYRVNS